LTGSGISEAQRHSPLSKTSLLLFTRALRTTQDLFKTLRLEHLAAKFLCQGLLLGGRDAYAPQAIFLRYKMAPNQYSFVRHVFHMSGKMNTISRTGSIYPCFSSTCLPGMYGHLAFLPPHLSHLILVQER
jgi:hypothetical protein